MPERHLTVTVYDQYGNVVGSGSGTYIDDSQTLGMIKTESHTIPITVYDENGNVIGNGTLEYTEYVTYNGGGSRTINVTGTVYNEDGDPIGTVTGELIDTYGAVAITLPSKAIYVDMYWSMWMILLAITMVALTVMSVAAMYRIAHRAGL